jgi:hypothetical protein
MQGASVCSTRCDTPGPEAAAAAAAAPAGLLPPPPLPPPPAAAPAGGTITLVDLRCCEGLNALSPPQAGWQRGASDLKVDIWG